MVFYKFIKELARLKGAEDNIDAELKYIINKFAPVSTATEIAKTCIDKEGNLNIEELLKYMKFFAPAATEEMKKYKTWKDFKKKLDEESETVDFSKSLHDILKHKK